MLAAVTRPAARLLHVIVLLTGRRSIKPSRLGGRKGKKQKKDSVFVDGLPLCRATGRVTHVPDPELGVFEDCKHDSSLLEFRAERVD